MPFYVWWAIPIAATLLAVVWMSWRSRERTIDPHDSVAARLRFEEALREPPTRGRPRTASPKDTPAEVDLNADTDKPAAERRRGPAA